MRAARAFAHGSPTFDFALGFAELFFAIC